jgi:hypothetical protein
LKGGDTLNIKKGLDFFSFDVDFFQDDKIQFVSARFGIKGEIITIRLLCRIYRAGYYIDWNEDTALLFAKGVGDGVSYSCVNDVVNELLKRGFFDEEIFKTFGVLTSRGIQRRYCEATKRRKVVEVEQRFLLTELSLYPNVRIISEDVNIQSQNVYIPNENDNILKQSKESKESKVKKRENAPLDSLSNLPPTLEDITAFCVQRKSNVNPKKFFEYYNARNWVNAKGTLILQPHEWKSTIISWENNGGTRNDSNQANTTGKDYSGNLWED